MNFQSQIENTKSQISLVVFDLGRVLVRICDNWEHACEVAGLKEAAGKLDEAQEAAFHEAVYSAEVGDLDIPGFARLAGEQLKMADDDVIRVSSAYLRGTYPGAVELLDELAAAGMKTACLSNTNANHWRLLMDRSDANFFPLDRLTFQFASHLVRMRKPEDRIYAHLEAQTNTPGEQIIFFDDLADNIAAARKRGWNACHIRTDSDPIAQERKVLRELGILKS